MTDRLEQLDISALSAYRRHLGRGSVAGLIGGVLVAGGAMTQASAAGSTTRAGLLVAGGVGIVLLSLWLRRGSVVAARLLSPVVVLGIMLALKMLATRLRGAALGNIVSTLLLTGLVVLPIFVSLIGGIEAVLYFTENRLSESFPALDFRSLGNPLTVAEAGLRRLEQQLARSHVFLTVSEAMVLIGASTLLTDAVWRMSSTPRPEWLALVGFVLLLLGLDFNLRAVRQVTQRMRARLYNDPRPPVLLFRFGEETSMPVRSRFTLAKILSGAYPYLSLRRVVREQMLACGPVVTLNNADSFSDTTHKQALPTQENGHHQIMEVHQPKIPSPVARSFQRDRKGGQPTVTHWLERAGCIVMILDYISYPGRRLTLAASACLRQKGVLVFPPGNDARFGWPDWWEPICPPPTALSQPDLQRGVLLVFRGNREPLLITAQTHDEWSYEVAFRIAAETIRQGANQASPSMQLTDQATAASGRLLPPISDLSRPRRDSGATEQQKGNI